MKSLIPLFLLLPLSISTVSAHDGELQKLFDFPHAHEAIQGHLHATWNSRYVTEGRDVLHGESLAEGSFELGYEHWVGGVWYGQSDNTNYEEWQASLGLTNNWKNIEFYGAYKFVRVETASADDHELGLGFTWTQLPLNLEFSADLTYSYEAEAYFAEIALSREVLLSDRLSILYSVPFGINQGYVSDGHDGANHLAARVGVKYSIFQNLSFTAHATQNFALRRDDSLKGDASLKNFFYVGGGLEWSF